MGDLSKVGCSCKMLKSLSCECIKIHKCVNLIEEDGAIDLETYSRSFQSILIHHKKQF